MQKESNLALLAAAGLAGGGYLAYRKYRAGKQESESRAIPMREVDSSMIRELGYSPKSKVMHARFNTGRRYRYEGVPLKEYRRLREAESIGTHFNSHIRGKYDHEKIGSFQKEAFAGMIAGGLVGAGIGGVMNDSQGNAGGVGGALTGALMGAAGGHLLSKGLASAGSKVKSIVAKKPPSSATPPQAATPPNQPLALPPPNQPLALPPPNQPLALPPPPPPRPSTYGKDWVQGIDDIQLPNMDFSVGPSDLLRVPLSYGSDAIGAIRSGATALRDRVRASVQNVALSANLRFAPGQATQQQVIPIIKNASYSGITLINDEMFEKVAFTPAVTTLAQAGAGAAVGALVNKEDRLRGALTGGLIGGVAGGMLGRMGGKELAKSRLDAAGMAKYKAQSSALGDQLSSTTGLTNRQNAIETFLKNPANKEFTDVYRQSMLGGTAGAMGLGAIASVPQNDPHYKTAAYRAVERLHHVRGY